MERLKILVGCECSGRVALAFAELGHEAYSCDLKKGEAMNAKFKNGGTYKHVQGDVFEVVDGIAPNIGIFHPPCTFMAGSGAQWLDDPRYPNRRKDLQQAVEFAKKLWRLKIKHIALENPVGLLSTYSNDGMFADVGKPTQIIQPWQFGDDYQKTTCLWLKNLPPLISTKIVGKGEFFVTSSGKKLPKWYSDAKTSDLEATRTIRSRTSNGIASAMARQWSSFAMNVNEFQSMFMI